MKAIKIDPEEKLIYEIQLEGGLSELQSHVGGMIGIYHDPILKADVVYCDDFTVHRGKWTSTNYNQWIKGKSLLIGQPDNRGNSTPYKGLEISELRKHIQMDDSYVGD